VLLLRGDTVGAHRALRDARGKAPAEEMPGVLLLSLQSDPQGTAAGAWEDSLRWGYSLSPETRLLGAPRARAVAAAPAAPAKDHAAAVSAPVPATRKPGAWSLQLGVFSQPENAGKFVQELAAKKIPARVEPMQGRTGTLHRVLYGSFATEAAAVADGKKMVKPKGYEYRVVGPEK
jgi:cell division protein FtsN